MEEKKSWIKEFISDAFVPYWKYKCPICGSEKHQESFNYCAVCGADLKEEGGNENENG